MKRVRAAAVVTLLIHVTITILAIPFALQSSKFHEHLDAHPRGVHALGDGGGAYLFDALFAIKWSGAKEMAVSLLVPIITIAIVSPYLIMVWLGALRDGPSIRTAIRIGSRHFGRSILTSIVIGLIAIPILAIIIGTGWLGHALTAESADARLHDLVTLGATIPGLLLLAALATTHDLARARLVLDAESTFRAVGMALRALSLRRCLQHWSLVLFGLLLVWVSASIGALLDEPNLGASLLTVLTVQSVALFRTYVRSYWLGVALTATTPAYPQAAEAEAAAEAAPGSLGTPAGGPARTAQG